MLAYTKKAIKFNIKDKMVQLWQAQISGLVQQGCMIQLLELEQNDNVWKGFNLKYHGGFDVCVKCFDIFDTLLSRSTLPKCDKCSASKCDLCYHSKETLMHKIIAQSCFNKGDIYGTTIVFCMKYTKHY